MKRVTFIVAEQSYLIRKGIVSIINRIEHASVVNEMNDLEHINSDISRHRPDFIVLNPNLIPHPQHFRNFEIRADLRKKGIAITTLHPRRYGMIRNYREIIDINDSKETIFGKLEKIVEPVSELKNRDIPSNELSEREKTILSYVAKGLTNKEIAEKLFLSTHTVITHRKNITAKLGIKTISGLTVYAILNNLVKMEELK